MDVRYPLLVWAQLPVTKLIVCFVAVIDGQFCEELTTEHGKVSCCLPCPLAEWTYGESMSATRILIVRKALANKDVVATRIDLPNQGR